MFFRSIVAPIYMSTTTTSHASNSDGIDLNMTDNPTRRILEQTLAALDNGKYAIVLPSGTAAQSVLITTLKAGDGIVCGDNIYTGTIELFRETAVDIGLKVIFVDMTRPEELRKALKSQKSTKIVWIESPSNPMMLLSDIQNLSDIVHNESDAIVVVDNTPLSCYFQRPLDFGADAVSYSITKFVNGHNDCIMFVLLIILFVFHAALFKLSFFPFNPRKSPLLCVLFIRSHFLSSLCNTPLFNFCLLIYRSFKENIK